MKVPFLDLKTYNNRYEQEIRTSVDRVLSSGWYLFGEEKKGFEAEYSYYIGVKETIGVGSGLDALKIILKALCIQNNWENGDEVIVPANTFIASILAIFDIGLKPVLIEPVEATFNINPAKIEDNITSRTKAIMIVHLYGLNAFTPEIKELCDRYNLKLIEDAAQAHGAYHEGKQIGTLGDASAFSFYPGKNLGAMGDAGAICTNNKQLADICRALSNYGGESKYIYKYKGFNSRMDEVQAAVLRVKLKGLDQDNLKRREVANYYLEHIQNPKVKLPNCTQEKEHVWHLFIVRVSDRSSFLRHMDEHEVEVSIHYPIAANEQTGYPELHGLNLPITKKLHREVVSLPMSPILTKKQIRQVVGVVNNYKLGAI